MWDEAVPRQFAAFFVVDVVVGPVRLLVDDTLLVVEERVDEDKALDTIRIRGGEEGADSTTEARSKEVYRPRSHVCPYVVSCCANVVHDPGKRQITLIAFTLSMRPEVEAQRWDACACEASGKTWDEPTLIPSSAASMNA